MTFDNMNDQQRERAYAAGVNYLNKRILIPKDYEKAAAEFMKIPGWKDADALLQECEQKLAESKAQDEAKQLEKERIAAMAPGEIKRKRKYCIKIALAIVASVCAILLLIPLFQEVIIPCANYCISFLNYNSASRKSEAGDVIGAYETWAALGDFKDSSDRAKSIYEQYKEEKLRTAEVGGTVFLGTYEQDGNMENGPENVEWLVLAKEGSRILVISKYALDHKEFNEESKAVAWRTSSLRQWLNGEFFNTVFIADEMTMIPLVTVFAHKNEAYEMNPGKDTEDRVFLLSHVEADWYFFTEEAVCQPTAYACGRTGDDPLSESVKCQWWLRSTGGARDRATAVSKAGKILGYGLPVNSKYAYVRPAIWIDLSTLS